MDLGQSEQVPAPVKLGNPTKYHPTIVNKLLKLLEEGNPIGLACQLSGITHDTYNRWVRADIAGDLTFSGFSDKANEARAKAQERIAGQWRNHFDTDWKAAHKYLAIINPDVWADPDRRAANQQGMTINVTVLNQGDTAALAGLLAQQTDPIDVIDLQPLEPYLLEPGEPNP